MSLINGADPTSNSSMATDSFSPDEKCPNFQLGLYRNDERS